MITNQEINTTETVEKAGRISVSDAIGVLMDLRSKETDPIVRKALGMGVKGLIFERNAAYLVHSIPSDWGVKQNPNHKDKDDGIGM